MATAADFGKRIADRKSSLLDHKFANQFDAAF
jgi:hypothetical protein